MYFSPSSASGKQRLCFLDTHRHFFSPSGNKTSSRLAASPPLSEAFTLVSSRRVLPRTPLVFFQIDRRSTSAFREKSDREESPIFLTERDTRFGLVGELS